MRSTSLAAAVVAAAVAATAVAATAVAAAVVATAVTAAALPGQADISAASLPEGAHRDLVVRTCALCHPIDLVVAQRRTQEQWEELIGKMLDRGAQATDAEQAQILEYLVHNFGRKD
jgi:cytochrome c5